MTKRARRSHIALAIPAMLTWMAACEAVPSSEDDQGVALEQPLVGSPPLLGVNIHHGGNSASENQHIADILKSRGLKTVRMDFNYDQDMMAFRDQVERLRNNGIKAEAILFPTYQWDARCNLDLGATESDAYAQTTKMVDSIKDLVTDFELLNEVQLRPELQAEVTWNTSPDGALYATKPCYLTKGAVLRGMFRAVRDVRSQSGLPLKVIVGAVGRDFGFLDFVRGQGVDFDLAGYHIYPWENHAPLDQDTWFGAGGPLGQLARFARPVRINEFNCGEIYGGGYENEAGRPMTEACLRSVTKHMLEIVNQTVVDVQSVHFYELFDEPWKAAPENRFGLLYSANAPKVHLYVASAFAGGSLSPAESGEITSRGLLTSQQIDAFRVGAGAVVDTGGAVMSPGTSTGTDAGTTATSGEITIQSISNETYVAYCYRILLGRDPDAGGLQSFTEALNNGATKLEIETSIYNSREYRQRARKNNYRPAPSTNALSNEVFMEVAFITLLRRDIDTSARESYVARLNAGAPRADIIREILHSTEFTTNVH